MSELEPAPAPAVTTRSWPYLLLWGIALTSLLLNILLIAGLWRFQARARAEITAVTATLEGVRLRDMTLPLTIDESVPLALTVPFSDTFQVPLSMTVPISTTFAVQETIQVPLDEVVSIDRDVTVNLSILGQRVPVNIPIRADVPIRMEANVPLDLQLPVRAALPLDLVVDVPVQTELPVNGAIPVQMELPLTLPLGELGLNDFLAGLRELGRSVAP